MRREDKLKCKEKGEEFEKAGYHQDAKKFYGRSLVIKP
jgi:exonuclease 1